MGLPTSSGRKEGAPAVVGGPRGVHAVAACREKSLARLGRESRSVARSGARGGEVRWDARGRRSGREAERPRGGRVEGRAEVPALGGLVRVRVRGRDSERAQVRMDDRSSYRR